jgi:vancomycin resistance protein YoaR
VSFDGSRVEVTRPVMGAQIQADRAAAALQEVYLDEGASAELSLAPATPDIDESDVQKAVSTFANRAVSGPVTLRFDDARVRLEPRQFGPALGMRPQDGELVPELDEKRLLELVDAAISKDGAPVDATVALVGGRPQVVPDRPGVSYEPDDVSSTFLDLVQRPSGRREQQVEATVARAEFRTKDARALRIVERVSTFTTYYPHADYRNTNIGRAAELVDGTVLKPGETFSLNETVGERTRENGFTEGFIISDGIFKEDLGGGVSQMATTTFNAMFFAGLEDVEHKPHSFYIDRYPVGREATVAWGSVDLRFRNDTPYGVLISARVTPSTPSSSGVVTVSMYSTKYWDITARTSDRYNFTEEDTRIVRSEDCYPNDGYAGFDVDVTRIFRRAGESAIDHRETFHTTYIPSDTVICR